MEGCKDRPLYVFKEMQSIEKNLYCVLRPCYQAENFLSKGKRYRAHPCLFLKKIYPLIPIRSHWIFLKKNKLKKSPILYVTEHWRIEAFPKKMCPSTPPWADACPPLEGIVWAKKNKLGRGNQSFVGIIEPRGTRRKKIKI